MCSTGDDDRGGEAGINVDEVAVASASVHDDDVDDVVEDVIV
jgi:hypothetical protein